MTIIVVTGSREFNTDHAKQFVHDVLSLGKAITTTIYQGGAKGVDLAAKEYALMEGIPCREFKANWDQFGKAAGPRRNRLMVETAYSMLTQYQHDVQVLAFHWHDPRLTIEQNRAKFNRGTRNCANIALEYGLTVHHFTYSRPTVPEAELSSSLF